MLVEQKQRPHISATQLNMICACPEAYRRRYIEGEKIPPGFAAHRGSGMHGGAEVNMRQKITTHTDLATGDIIDAAVAKFDQRLAEGVTLTDEERETAWDLVVGRERDKVATLAAVHAAQQAPDYQPVFVEESVKIELSGTHDLLGIIDLADDRGRVTDFKTAARSKSQSDADASVQLTVYDALYRAKTGEPAKELRLDTLVSLKRETKRQVISSTRGPADVSALAERIESVTALIQAGIFIPAPPGAWNCSQKWCGYFDTCRFVNSERREKQTEGE